MLSSFMCKRSTELSDNLQHLTLQLTVHEITTTSGALLIGLVWSGKSVQGLHKLMCYNIHKQKFIGSLSGDCANCSFFGVTRNG